MAKKDNKAVSKNDAPFSRAYSRLFLGLCCVVRPFLHGKCTQTKAFKEQKKKGAMLVVSNHLSAYDFIHFSSAMHGAPLNFVVAENMMYSTPIFAKLIGGYHAITKKQYVADFQCIKKIKRYLDKGVSVLICPEGKVSADGVTGEIMPSIARLVQWLGYPVGVIKMKGASLARPKWAHNLRMVRKGSVYADCDMLFTKEDTQNLSKDEIYEKICKALYHNEHKWQVQNCVEFKGRCYAEGLERLLYYCPNCKSEFAMRTEGNKLICDNCKNEATYTSDGRLVAGYDSVTFDRIDSWYAMQKKYVAQEVENPDFRISDEVNLFVENEKNNGYRFVAKGVLTLDKEGLFFDTDWLERPSKVKARYGVNNMTYEVDKRCGFEPVEEEFKHIKFAINRTNTVANLPGTAIDMYDESHVYRFMFCNRKSSTKYVIAIEQMYKNCAKES